MPANSLPSPAFQALGRGEPITFPRRKDVVVLLVWYGLCLLIGFWMVGAAFSMLLFLLGWALGLIGDATLATSGLAVGMVYMLVMIGLIISWLRSVLYLFLGQLAGRETVEIQASTLVVATQLFGSKKVQPFLLNKIRHLRVTMPNPFLGQLGFITFEYETQKIRLGWMMNKTEAQQVVAILKQHFLL